MTQAVVPVKPVLYFVLLEARRGKPHTPEHPKTYMLQGAEPKSSQNIDGFSVLLGPDHRLSPSLASQSSFALISAR